jgi:mono/diheme cytochrome c family protein
MKQKVLWKALIRRRFTMSKSKLLILVLSLLTFASACRYDMQDQPKYKAYKEMKDGIGSREPVDGTIARGYLREDKGLYTGKKEGVTTVAAQSAVDANGNTVVTTFPDAIEEFPIAITKETLDRGEQRFKVFCGVCHGALGSGDGMLVRRGFSKPPSYHDDRLRNAPVGHFFDVASNGWGKMNGYSAQISVNDRWAIVAYIRALQLSQNANGMKPMPISATAPKTETAPVTATEAKPTTNTNANVAVKPANITAKPVANVAVKPVSAKPVTPATTIKSVTANKPTAKGGK